MFKKRKETNVALLNYVYSFNIIILIMFGFLNQISIGF